MVDDENSENVFELDSDLNIDEHDKLHDVEVQNFERYKNTYENKHCKSNVTFDNLTWEIISQIRIIMF